MIELMRILVSLKPAPLIPVFTRFKAFGSDNPAIRDERISTMQRIDATFFERHPVICARELIGAHFEWDGTVGRIVETEAYLSVDDPACHTWNRPSTRAFVESHLAGDAYVYLNYGMHWLFNVLVKSNAGSGFVLMRALEPVSGERWLTAANPASIGAGPGKLTKLIGIDGSAHGTRFMQEPGRGLLCGDPVETCDGVRIGITKAREHPWRFGDPRSKSLSRKF